MTFDIQAAVVSPFNGLKKRLSEWLANSSPASSDLPPAMKHLAPQGSVSSLVAPALSADLLRIICDSGFVSLGLDPNPERTALVMPLASALLKQLPGQQQSQGLSAFISDVGPFGYRCGLTKWVGARLCTKAAAATRAHPA
jgi:hypothetical protein